MAVSYQRVLLKLSGEAFSLGAGEPLSQERLLAYAQDIRDAVQSGIQIGIVLGAGNWIRGRSVQCPFIARTSADHMGMIATLLNAIALRDALLSLDVNVYAGSALEIVGILPKFDVMVARECLSQGGVVIAAGGTGNPFVTTDSAASLRAVELEADILLKATKVDGVYSADPNQNPTAERYSQLRFDTVLSKKLEVMDLGAFAQCQSYGIAIRVFDLFKPGALLRALRGEAEGTLISAGDDNAG